MAHRDIQDEAEQRAVDTLLAHLSDGEYRAVYVASSGVCLPHLTRALKRDWDTATAELVAIERQRLAGLLAELEEYLRKQRHEHRHEPRGPEQTAPRRAVMNGCGVPGICWPPRSD